MPPSSWSAEPTDPDECCREAETLARPSLPGAPALPPAASTPASPLPFIRREGLVTVGNAAADAAAAAAAAAAVTGAAADGVVAFWGVRSVLEAASSLRM